MGTCSGVLKAAVDSLESESWSPSPLSTQSCGNTSFMHLLSYAMALKGKNHCSVGPEALMDPSGTAEHSGHLRLTWIPSQLNTMVFAANNAV